MKCQCPSCNQRYDISPDDIGSLTNCQICQVEFEITSVPENAEIQPSGKSTQQRLNTPPRTQASTLRSTQSGAQKVAANPLTSGGSNRVTLKKALLDVRVFLGWLADGSLIRNVTAYAIYLLASLAALGSLIIWFYSLRMFGFADGIIGFLGSILWCAFFPYSMYLVVSAAFARATDIRKLPAGQFAISPILSVIINLHGEIVFILCAAWSLPVALLAWGSYTKLAMFYDIPLSNGFILGGALFILMWLTGYVVYLFTRWVQELIYVFPSMAHNLDLIEKNLRGDHQ
jgi:hypothetical protein